MTTSLRSVQDVQRRLEKMEYMAAMATPPLSCYIENGFDYVNQDITSVPSATAEGCCWPCYTTNGCKAYSWTSYNGGTCWLKSGRGSIIVNPNVRSALLLYGSNPVCQLQNDVDYVGNDIARVPSATAAGCCDICHNYLGCRAYSWSDYLGGSCWLKSKGDQTVSKPGVKSAQAYPSGQGSSCNLMLDTDFLDNDIGNAPSPTAGGCCQICQNNPQCRAFAWTNQNGGTCWLKSLKGTQISKPGVIAAQVKPNPPPDCVLSYDLDYLDHDIANRPSDDATLCCSICRAYPGCGAFSWSNYNGGTCWLKSKKGTTLYKVGVKSAVVAPVAA